MGLVWLEGMEWPAAKTNSNGTTPLPNPSGGSFLGGNVTPGGRTGYYMDRGYGLVLGAADQDDLITVGCAFETYHFDPGNKEIMAFQGDTVIGAGPVWTSSTRHVTVVMSGLAGATVAAKVYRGGSGGTLLGTATAVTLPPVGSWVHIAAQVRLHDTTGSVTLKIDDTTVLALTNVDTKNGGTGTVIDSVVVQSYFGGFGAFQGIDDFYLTNEQGSKNTGFLGPLRVYYAAPDGNGATSNGVGSDGDSTDNYLLVDDLPTALSTSDYVAFAATGDKDTYTFANISPVSGSVVPGVMVSAYAEKDDAGARTARLLTRLSGTEGTGADLPLLNGTYTPIAQMFENDPAGSDWTVSNANSAEYGFQARP